MTTSTEDAAWDEGDTRHFIDYGAYFVPEREVQIDTLCSVVPPPPDGGVVVEICSGEGLLAEALARRFPTAFIHALDGSETMLAATAARLDDTGSRYRTTQMEIADSAWRHFDTPVSSFVSSLAIHHLDGAGKAELFSDLATQLAPGGALVICDIIEPRMAETLALWEKHWDQGVRERAIHLDGHTDKLEFFRKHGWNYYSDPEADPVDQPSSLLEQLLWLGDAGLVNAEVHWLKAGHAIFSARKPI